VDFRRVAGNIRRVAGNIWRAAGNIRRSPEIFGGLPETSLEELDPSGELPERSGWQMEASGEAPGRVLTQCGCYRKPLAGLPWGNFLSEEEGSPSSAYQRDGPTER
jgi:hypothetical protein